MDRDRTTKGWRRDEYTDPLDGSLLGVEVTPERDLKGHVSSERCECVPILKYTRDHNGISLMTLVHNSFDGREVPEKDEKGH